MGVFYDAYYVCNADASIKCFVCGANTLVTFKPCGHSVLCEVCGQRIKRCPTCKVYTLVVVEMCLNSCVVD